MLKRFWETVKAHPYWIAGAVFFIIVLIMISGRSTAPAQQAAPVQDNSAAIQANAQLAGLQASLSSHSADVQAQLAASQDTNQTALALANIQSLMTQNNNTIAANVALDTNQKTFDLQSLVASLNAGVQNNATNAAVSVAANNNKTLTDLAGIDLTKTQTTSTGLAQTITALYNSVLGRAPDTAGLTYWENMVASGTPISSVISSFTNSAENSNHTAATTAAAGGSTGGANTVAAAITQDYTSFFGRAPDAAGLAYWTGQANSGLSLSDINATFASAAASSTTH